MFHMHIVDSIYKIQLKIDYMDLLKNFNLVLELIGPV